MVLSSVSPFFKTLLLENPCRHPIVILPSGIDLSDLETIVQFVYGGEVEVPEARLDSVLRAAEQLQKQRTDASSSCAARALAPNIGGAPTHEQPK